jgi:hypothetical protein
MYTMDPTDSILMYLRPDIFGVKLSGNTMRTQVRIAWIVLKVLGSFSTRPVTD